MLLNDEYVTDLNEHFVILMTINITHNINGRNMIIHSKYAKNKNVQKRTYVGSCTHS